MNRPRWEINVIDQGQGEWWVSVQSLDDAGVSQLLWHRTGASLPELLAQAAEAIAADTGRRP